MSTSPAGPRSSGSPTRSRPLRVSLPLALALVAIACGSEVVDVPRDVVARIGTTELTLDAFERYVEAHLGSTRDARETTDDSDDPEARAAVRSRLFDAFLEESLLVVEAERRGITVSEEAIDRAIEAADAASDAPPPDEHESGGASARREVVRRALTIDRLVRSSVLAATDVSERALDAYLLREGRDAGDAVALRALRLPDEATARRTIRDIRRDRMTFEEAVALHEPVPGQADPVRMTPAQMPAPVREAVAEVRPGWTTDPVEFAGDWYLFRVEADDGVLDDPRADARRELLRRGHDEAVTRLLEEARSRLAVARYLEHLPFDYVPPA